MQRRGLLTHRHPVVDPERVARAWLAYAGQITSGDYARLTGVSQTSARNALEKLVRDGVLARGAATGRNAHFIAAA